VALWLRTGVDGSVYNVTPDVAHPHREWFRAWGRSRRQELHPFFLRAWFLRFAAWAATMLKRALGKQGKVDMEYAIAAATRNLRYANTKAKEELGWAPAATDRFLG
jgi:nucleoside-diphosphate-sugar epimerase